MSDIKSYLKEKQMREQNQAGYKDKIKQYRLAKIYRLALVLFALVAVGLLIGVQYKRHIYTNYDVVNSIKREEVIGARDCRLNDAILTYSKDGAHCMNMKGEVSWNKTYEIQDVRLAICGGTVAIAEYNGRKIYIQNEEKEISEFTTAMPIKDIAVSDSGYVTAVLDGTDVTLINTYDFNGELLYPGQAHMNGSGYPASISLSPGGELLCVSYWYVDAGIMKSNIVFYNLGPIGSNVNDFIVSAYVYTDVLVPQVQFMNDSTAFAVGDDRLMIYTGAHIPSEKAQYFYDGEVKSVFYSDKYIGLVFRTDDLDGRYRLDVYNTGADKVGSYTFDIEYTDLFFGKDNFVVYNDTECRIITLDGVEKFSGSFTKPVRLMMQSGGAFKYRIVTDNSIDTIQLK